MKERFPHCKSDADLKKLSEFDRVFGMLIMHNTKVDKIQGKYRQEMEKKKKAKELGITLKELEEKESGELITDIDTKKKKFGGKKVAKKDDFEVVIKMKDPSGEILDYDMQKALAQSFETSGEKTEEGKEIDPPATPSKIEAEDTLDMIQKALGGTGFGDFKAPAKKKTVTKKKIVKKKEHVDTLQRFFNNYGENPHL